jgi:hypothetical protein
MPDVKIDMQMTITVNPLQFNLIGLALAGRLTEAQKEEAAELNRTLLNRRLAAHEIHVKNTKRAIESLGADPAQLARAAG